MFKNLLKKSVAPIRCNRILRKLFAEAKTQISDALPCVWRLTVATVATHAAHSFIIKTTPQTSHFRVGYELLGQVQCLLLPQ